MSTRSVTGHYVSAAGARLWVEQAGAGPALLLIPGLGTGNWLWNELIPLLERDFTLVMPELRGSARSDKPDERYSIPQFAADLVAVLDAMQIDRVHVLGASMGGFVAQQLAADAPARVRHLVLAATSLGGARQIGPPGDILARTIRPRGRSRRERLEDAWELGFTPQFRSAHRERLDAITDWRLTNPQPEWAYYRQVIAGWAFDGLGLARAITAPTLVCAGEDDEVVPVINAHELQRSLEGAAVTVFPGRHLFLLEHAAKFAEVVKRFLHTGTAPERA